MADWDESSPLNSVELLQVARFNPVQIGLYTALFYNLKYSELLNVQLMSNFWFPIHFGVDISFGSKRLLDINITLGFFGCMVHFMETFLQHSPNHCNGGGTFWSMLLQKALYS